jgi:hypothetical protein
MAYPTVSAPYGLKPVNLVGGLPFAGATRQFKIASGYGTGLFNGDLVKLVTGGTVEKDAGTTTATPVGVFLGCSYTDPTLGYKLFSQYWPASTVASDAVAYVCDDPNALFKVVAVSGTTVVAGYSIALIGSNVSLVQNAGSTATGNSKVAILGTSSNTTNTLPIRVIDVVADTATGADAFVEYIVKVNVGSHQYTNSTGV